jgi:hypothetical protein
MNVYPSRKYARNFYYVVADWKHLLPTAAEIISGAGAIKKYNRKWLWFGPV